MPEYLTPGVYVEETSFRARSIEGVATSTVGMAGLTRYGPVSHAQMIPLPPAPGALPTAEPKYDEHALVAPPPLITSYGEFERAFGGLGDVGGGTNYLAFAVRAYFANGGRRVYISRVFPWPTSGTAIDTSKIDGCFAKRPLAPPAPAVPPAAPANPVGHWRARWPGAAGREIKVRVELRRSRNVAVGSGADTQLKTVREHALVELGPEKDGPPKDTTLPVPGNVRQVRRVGDRLRLVDDSGAVDIPSGQAAYHLQLIVTVTWGSRSDVYSELAVHPEHPRSVLKVLERDDPPDSLALVWLRPAAPINSVTTAANLLTALLDPKNHGYLTEDGSDGREDLTAADFTGAEADADNPRNAPTGLNALTDIDDVAIVAMPDTGRFPDLGRATAAVGALIEHCERQRYRIAIVDPPAQSSMSEVRTFRQKFDSRYAALYYPWVEIIDPTAAPDPGAAPPRIPLPPSGFVAGIYARSDVERGVHKAPANEVIRGIDKFETNVTYDRQAVLNPEGINALRFFTGRSNRVWGARTLSSDPEWKYVNVRRLFIFLEHSIDRATQWAVFEPNNERLWASIRRSIEDFLLVQWRAGALLGTRPEEAYFVRCDRSTMTQNDLDNGRLICLVGVAPTYPAEFVIFRIGQWTADAQRA